MAGKNTSVVGIYDSREAVERAVSSFRDAGFRSLDLSVLFPANVGSKDFAYEKGTKDPEGATAGGGTGAVIGGAILLSVHSDDAVWTMLAKEVLERTGANEISSTSEIPGDYQNSDRPMPQATV